jgi:hypothetical protein
VNNLTFLFAKEGTSNPGRSTRLPKDLNFSDVIVGAFREKDGFLCCVLSDCTGDLSVSSDFDCFEDFAADEGTAW